MPIDFHELAPVDCPHCGYRIICADAPPGVPVPRPGTLMICFSCTNLCRFDGQMKLTANVGALTPEEFTTSLHTKMRVLAMKERLPSRQHREAMHGHRN